ncbi:MULTISPECIES: nucleotidyltransferase family protein [Phascolarctobacterium]|uniref:nucleotidyltransferase family protein n=1 Tax=Phascolarctobacterium TaxID=33024 RepID=UPI0025DE5DB6|nr:MULTISPECIES: nucleotidyltransferase domain-containing protein [Phascolarctobacterium]
MTLEEIKRITTNVIKEYPITKVTLFGSRADNTNKENSDVDFIVEFSEPVSLITIAKLQLKLENALKLDVDIIHGPIRQDDMIEINKEVEIYAA